VRQWFWGGCRGGAASTEMEKQRAEKVLGNGNKVIELEKERVAA
jgi:hypothetical protein